MGASILKASIKKIEVVNKTLKNDWHQSVRVILGDIELNNENFLALKKFRPDEIVHVAVESAEEELSPSKGSRKRVIDEVMGIEEEGEQILGNNKTIEQEFQL